jgi:hypothetical protein
MSRPRKPLGVARMARHVEERPPGKNRTPSLVMRRPQNGAASPLTSDAGEGRLAVIPRGDVVATILPHDCRFCGAMPLATVALWHGRGKPSPPNVDVVAIDARPPEKPEATRSSSNRPAPCDGGSGRLASSSGTRHAATHTERALVGSWPSRSRMRARTRSRSSCAFEGRGRAPYARVGLAATGAPDDGLCSCEMVGPCTRAAGARGVCDGRRRRAARSDSEARCPRGRIRYR